MLKIILVFFCIFIIHPAMGKTKDQASSPHYTVQPIWKVRETAKKKSSNKADSATQLSDEALELEYEEGEDFQPSLLESLNNSNQLKSNIKREIAVKAPKKISKKAPKKLIQFGVMSLKISDRKEEETLEEKK